MKNRINKFVLAGMVAAGVSCLSPLAFAVEKQSATGIDPDIESTLGISEDHNKQMDDLNREKELLELQSSLSKLKLEKEKTEVDLKKLKGQPVPVAAEAPVATAATPDFSQMAPMQDMGAFSNQGQAQSTPRKIVEDSPLDRVYVTRIYGIGGVKSVTTYFDNGIFTGAAGDEIVSGLRIVKVTENGAVFSYKGKTKNVNLTTQGLAYSRSQAKQREAASQSSSSRSANAGFMSNMATEIGATTIIPPPHPR